MCTCTAVEVLAPDLQSHNWTFTATSVAILVVCSAIRIAQGTAVEVRLWGFKSGTRTSAGVQVHIKLYGIVRTRSSEHFFGSMLGGGMGQSTLDLFEGCLTHTPTQNGAQKRTLEWLRWVVRDVELDVDLDSSRSPCTGLGVPQLDFYRTKFSYLSCAARN